MDFIRRHKFRPSDFTRHCRLAFDTVVIFLLNLVKGALQRELDEYFKALSGDDVAHRVVTKSAFCSARQKLKPSAFVELNEQLIKRLYRQASIVRWRGLDVRSVDGTTLRLPDTPELIGFFGQMVPAQGDPVTMARVSQLYDPLNNIVHHSVMTPYAKDERSLLCEHLSYIHPGSLILLDAGYPAFWLLSLFHSRKLDWCVRMPLSSWLVVRDFLQTRKSDDIVTLKPSAAMRAECDQHGAPTAPLRVRLVRVILSTGETEVLMTSLVDREEYRNEEFSELYFMRWGHEEHYKRLKSRIEIENWSGKSVLTAFQDFYAKVFAMNLTIALTNTAQGIVNVRHAGDKHPKNINVTNAYCAMKNTITKLFIRANPLKIIIDLINLFADTVEPVRPGRSYPRKKGPRLHRYSANYKPCT